MIHDAKNSLPSTHDLTISQIDRLRQSLERSLEGVVEQWIQETGIERVRITIHTERSDALDRLTRFTYDLHADASVVVYPLSRVVFGEEEKP